MLAINEAMSQWVRKTQSTVGRGAPVTDLFGFRRRAVDFPLHVWGARIDKEMEKRLPESSERLVASGIGDTWDQARAGALGEAMERYSFALLDEVLERLEWEPPSRKTTVRQLFDFPFLLPRTRSRQKWAKEAAHSPIRYLSAKRIMPDGKQHNERIPVEVIINDERFNIFTTTNGMACGVTLEDATKRALKEVIERDALMLVWLTRTAGISLSKENVLNTEYCKWIDRAAVRGIRSILKDISTGHGYKVVLAGLIHEKKDGNRILSLGAGADLRLNLAAEHAFREACLGWKGMAWRSELGKESSKSEDVPANFAQHLMRYTRSDQYPEVAFLFEEDEDAIDEGDENIQINEDVFHDLAPFVIDITPPDIKTIGAVVVKVVISGLVPLTFADLQCDEMAAARLPVSIGGIRVSNGTILNDKPHPWP
ncbi:MAG: hypothetical protein GWP07_02455 [Xanthomonadaceae bacterium]|nr:hypothetical protein [Xanthomonadaceae bacterium]